MNQTRLRQPPLCASTRSRDGRRKPHQLPRCTVDWHHLPRERSWADAGTSTQPNTIPAHARAEGVSALSNSSKVLGIDNPLTVTRSYRTLPIFMAGGTWGHPGPVILAHAVFATVHAVVTGLFGRRAAARGGWLTGLPHRIGDLLFAGNDEEARWRGWSVEERHAGLARVYRDPAFDRMVQCPDCRGAGVTMAESRCAPCSGTGRLILDQPPIAHNA
jgi:hypothetical protein